MRSFLPASLLVVSLLLVAAGANAASEIAVVREWDEVAVPNGSTFSFGTEAAGAADSRRFRIYNAGAHNLTIANPTTLVSGQGFSLIANPVSPVYPGASTTFRVEFLATQPGDYTGAITISNNDPDENPYVIHLYGAIAAPPAPEIAVVREWDGVAVPNGGSFSFGTQAAGAADSRRFRIHNNGVTDLTIANPTTLVSGQGFSLIANAVSPVYPGASTTFRVEFLATQPGNYTGAITISNNDSDDNPYVIHLSGSIAPPPPPDIAVHCNWDNVPVPNGGSFTFPDTPVNEPVSRLFRIDNAGSQTLTIANPTTLVSGTGWSLIELPASSVPPGGSTTFRVRLHHYLAGTYSGSISIQTNDPDESPYTIALTGTVTAASNGAAFVSQSFPSSMVGGQTYSVSVTMRNIGTTTWTAAANYRLGIRPDNAASVWNVGRVALPAGISIGPGATHNFAFSLTAPSTPGNYSFQWQMVQEFVEWFGDVTPLVTISVAQGGNQAVFVGQNFPSSMTAGQSYSVSVTLRNSGTTTWTAAANYRLGIRPDNAASVWNVGRVVLPAGVSVAPGGTHVFAFTLTAPSTPGSHSFQWRMVQEMVEWFGDTTPLVTISVSQTVNNAAFVSQSVPTTMVAGQNYPVSVTMRNTGNTTWRAADMYRLGSLTPGTPFGSRVNLGPNDAIAPQSEKTFTWSVKAPATAGNYTFQWQMLKELVEWFGASAPAVTVNVRNPITPVVTSLEPQVIVSGRTELVTIDGSNFAGATVTASAAGRTLPGVSVVSVTATRIVVQVDASNPAVDGFYGLQIHGTEGMTAEPIRIVPDRPVIDSWTPSQAAGGDTYLLVINGENLDGATVRAGGGVVVYDVESAHDNTLTGTLEAYGSSGTTELEVVGRNGRSSRVTIELRTRAQIAKRTQMLEGKTSTGEVVPGIYLQEPAFAPRSTVDKTITFSCRFTRSRTRTWGRMLALFRNADTHQRDPNLLHNMERGETRNIEAFVAISTGSRTLSFDIYCGDHGLEIELCIEMDVYIEIVGIGSQYLYASACVGTDGPHATFGGNGFFNFEFNVSAGGGECTRVTPTNGTQNIEGLPRAEVEQLECCREDLSISGLYYLIDDPPGYARLLPLVIPLNGSAIPSDSCWADDIEITVRAFIPVNYIEDPAFGTCTLPQTPPRDILWKGDDRWYERFPRMRRFRAQQIINQNESVRVEAGETHVYADDALDGDGRITLADIDSVLDDCRLLHDVGVDHGIAARCPATHELVSPGVHRFHLVGAADNPLVLSPDINWDFWIDVNTNVSPPAYSMWGTHDCYPAYEVYINSHRIYGFVHHEIQPGMVTHRGGILNECLWPFNPHVTVLGCQGTLGASLPCGRQ